MDDIICDVLPGSLVGETPLIEQESLSILLEAVVVREDGRVFGVETSVGGGLPLMGDRRGRVGEHNCCCE